MSNPSGESQHAPLTSITNKEEQELGYYRSQVCLSLTETERECLNDAELAEERARKPLEENIANEILSYHYGTITPPEKLRSYVTSSMEKFKAKIEQCLTLHEELQNHIRWLNDCVKQTYESSKFEKQQTNATSLCIKIEGQTAGAIRSGQTLSPLSGISQHISAEDPVCHSCSVIFNNAANLIKHKRNNCKSIENLQVPALSTMNV